MTRALAAIVLALLIALPMEAAAREGRGGGRGGGPRLSFPSHGGSRHRGHGGHGGHHGHHGHHRHHFGGSSLFFYGSFGPYWYPGWPYRPYYYSYYPYYYPYYAYPYSYPPPWVPYRVDDDDDDRDLPAEMPPPADTETASYGLIRLDGVRDGAAVELDGRFWLTADDLDDRWLALPQGEHRIEVTVGDATPIVRTIRIVPGRTHVLKFDTRAERPT